LNSAQTIAKVFPIAHIYLQHMLESRTEQRRDAMFVWNFLARHSGEIRVLCICGYVLFILALLVTAPHKLE